MPDDPKTTVCRTCGGNGDADAGVIPFPCRGCDGAGVEPLADPLAPCRAIPSELRALRTIARMDGEQVPTIRVLLRHIAWLEGEVAERDRLLGNRAGVVVPLRERMPEGVI